MKPAQTFVLILLLSIAGFLAINSPAVANENAARPNVVLIMVDDMGFSDLGCYGGEIETPNLDSLAKDGLRFTQFYNCAKCETTRATLLSGKYYPEVGNTALKNCITIAEGMKSAGYKTIMTGKWHVQSTPNERGFDQYFGHLSGATNFFTGDDSFRLNQEVFEVPKKGFYTTDANTDYAIKFLNQAHQENPEQPFFLYIAYNAPHYPLQAPKEDVDKYRGKYKIGWDELRKRRFAKQKEIGLVPQDTKLTPRPSRISAWDTLIDSEKDHHDLMMATYAGMIDRVDQNIGKLIEKLESLGKRENTLIMFLDDNGACPFQRSKKESMQFKPWESKSYWCYDQRWAHACNTPFREYKQNQHEGGITSPMIVNWPARIKDAGSITSQPGHLVDIMSTCLEVAKTEYPTEIEGEKISPPRGLSLTPIFDGEVRDPHEAIFFSFYGKNNAIRVGDWKLVNINFGDFELYDLSKDRTELNNLAKSEPEQMKKMVAIWDRMSKEIGERKKPNPRGSRSKSKKLPR